MAKKSKSPQQRQRNTGTRGQSTARRDQSVNRGAQSMDLGSQRSSGESSSFRDRLTENFDREKMRASFDRYSERFGEWYETPAAKYVVGGVALAILSPLAMGLYRRYPGISRFFSENLDVVEDKLKEYNKGTAAREEGIEARH